MNAAVRMMVVVATSAAVASAVHAATYTSISWVPADGSFSGAFTDSAHWNPVTEGGPGSGYPDSTANTNQIAVFPRLNVTEDYTVTMPAGVCTNIAGLSVELAQNRAVVIDGSDTDLRFPALPEGATYAPIRITSAARRPGSVWYGGGNMMAWRRGDPSTDSGYLRNFKFDLSSNHGSVTGSKLVFTGEIKTESGSLEFFGRGNSDNYKEPDGRSQVILENGSVDGAGLAFSHDSATNIVTFSAFNVTNCSGFGHNTHYGYVGGEGRFELNFTSGSKVSSDGRWQFGWGSAASLGKSYRLAVTDGSKMNVKVLFDRNPGRYEHLVSGEGSSVVTYDSYVDYFGTASSSTSSVTIADGAYFKHDNPVYLGAESAVSVGSTWGELTVSNAQLFCRGILNVREGAVRLLDGAEVVFNSGTWAPGQITGACLAGADEKFFADGAVLRCRQNADVTILSALTSAVIGPKGLTVSVEANRNYTIAQPLEDASPDEGGELTILSCDAYPLVLAADSSVSRLTIAAGTVKLAADANHDSHLTVTNGATFSLVGGPSAITLKGLTLGDAASIGKLVLKSGDIVTVSGPIEFVNAAIEFSTTLASGSHTVFRTTVQPESSAAEQWELFGNGLFSAGIPEGYNRFSVVETDGVWEYRIDVGAERPVLGDPTVWQGGTDEWGAGDWSGGVPSSTVQATFAGATPKNVTVSGSVSAGGLVLDDADGYTFTGGMIKLSDVIGAAITAAGGDNTVNSSLQLATMTSAAVSEGATLTLSGPVRGGGLAKTGPGKLVLASSDNLITEGVSLNGGWLTLASPASLGYLSDSVVSTFTSGTLEFLSGGRTDIASTLNGSVVFKPEGDVVMKLPSVSSGAVVKRGAGSLVLETDAESVTLAAAPQPGSGWKYDAGEEVAYPADGSAPAKHAGIHVAEGELVLRGTGANVTKLAGVVGVALGMPVAEHSGEIAKQPGIVLDNVSGVSVSIPASTASNQFVTDPYIVVSNGANLGSWGSVPDGSGMRGLDIRVVNGTLGNNPLNYSGRSDSTNRYLLVDSSMRWYRRVVNGSTILVASNSVYASQNDFDLADRSTWKLSNIQPEGSMSAAPFVLDMTFAAGSIVMCEKIAATSNRTFPVTITFDDAEYFAGQGDATLMTLNLNVKTVVRGKGLKLYPNAGATWNFITPVTGDGEFVVAGEGTVRFDQQMKYGAAAADPVTLAYTGLTDIRAGTLVVSAGAMSNVVGRAFKVAGTLDMDGQTLSEAVVVTAGGTVRDVRLRRARFQVGRDGEGAVLPVVLDYANGLVTSGRTVFDFGVESGRPYPEGTVFTVARWTGTEKPDVSLFRGARVGDGLCCRFAAKDDGTVEATVRLHPGLELIVR